MADDGRDQKVELLVRNATVATLEGPQRARDGFEASDAGLEAGWAVAVKEGRIVWVGPEPDWRGKTARSLDARRKLVTPGFVDAHTHLVYAGDRAKELRLKLQGKSYQDILAGGGGILQTVRQTREATENELEESAHARLREMLHHGTTTLEGKSGYGLDTKTELKQLAVHPRLLKRTGVAVVSTFLGAHAVPEEYKGRQDAYVDLVCDEMLPAVGEQNIARYCDVFVDEGAFTVEQGERILKRAREIGFETRLHADELSDTGAGALAAKVGCVAADHLLKVSDASIKAMSEAGTIATLLPTVPVTMMKPQWAPAAKLLEALVPVAVATDHNPNNPVLDLGLAARLGCYMMGLNPAQALTAITWNAACALGVEGKVGSLEPGKVANLVVHDSPGLDQWAAALGQSTVRHVVLNGRLVPPRA